MKDMLISALFIIIGWFVFNCVMEIKEIKEQMAVTEYIEVSL